MASKLYRRMDACDYCGIGRSTMQNRINSGTFPEGVLVGAAIRAWFEHELDVVNAAAARGAGDDELRMLVKQIARARKTMGTDLPASAQSARATARPTRANESEHAAQA